MILSALDLSPVTGDATQAEAVRETIEIARAAERLGYHRLWLAEHHNIAGLGSPAPEILIAALTQATRTIRLGSGGVMLVNYSPLKVAEVFMELEALAPGRIDLGLGRALGTDARTGAALRSMGSDAFPQYFHLLTSWLLDAAGKQPVGDEGPLRDIHASPSGPSHPDVFVLCTSEESAAFAGQMGVGMVFAEFIARAEGPRCSGPNPRPGSHWSPMPPRPPNRPGRRMRCAVRPTSPCSQDAASASATWCRPRPSWRNTRAARSGPWWKPAPSPPIRPPSMPSWRRRPARPTPTRFL
jgi:hypothetical protein